jgi:TPR repeat protein
LNKLCQTLKEKANRGYFFSWRIATSIRFQGNTGPIMSLIFMSAEAGNRDAQRNAGYNIAQFESQQDVVGVLGRDWRVAHRFLEMAIKQGDEESKSMLANLVREQAAATKQLKTATRQGDDVARKGQESRERRDDLI